MRSRTDPIKRLKRLTAITVAGGTVVVAGCAWWALCPLPNLTPIKVELARPTAPDVVHADDVASIDARVFAARLWNPIPAPSAPAPAEEEVASKPQPLRLELVGIINDGGTLRAALYDADTDRLHIVSDGDQIGRLTVTLVAESHVELTDGRSTRRLSLREQSS